MKLIKIMLIASLLALGASCSNEQASRRKWVNDQLNSMTLREQVAQLFVVALHPRQGEAHINKVLAELHDEQIGGIIWGQTTPTEYVHLLNKMQAQVRIPLLVTIDAEWGVAMRLDSVIRFPQQLTLGAIQDNSLIYEFGLEVARQCHELGIHVNFAPVVDVNNNPNNPIINMRSFGENKFKVTEKAYAYMRGMQDGGIITTLKHFPGHGDTDRDSHDELPVILHDKQRINEIELYPFRELIKRGATGVMTAHLLIPALCQENIPSSQSKRIVTDLLQRDLGFRGLIVTDALEMKGALYNRDQDRVALYSLIAGNHILEIPIDVRASIDVIVNAVENGEVSRKLIRKRAKKVLEAKYDLGLHKGFEPINPDGILGRLNTPQAHDLRMRLAEASLTLLANGDMLPLQNSQTITHVQIGQGDTFKKQLQERANIELFTVDTDYTPENLDLITENIRAGETIIVTYHNNPRRQTFANFDIDDSMIDFIENLAKNNNVILVFFGNPYALANFNNLDLFSGLIAAYDNSDEAQTSSARAMFGERNFLGKLPITISPKFSEDFGLITEF